MSSSLDVRAKGLWAHFTKAKDQIAMALPRHLTPERMIRVAMTAAKRDSKILECDPMSVVGAVIEASQLGLEPDGILGYAYLVPFKGRCTLIPGYRGLIALAKRTAEVANVWANPVFKGDTFKYVEGIHRDLRHVPNLETDNREDPKNLTYVYAVITFKDGREPDFEVMTTAQVKGIQARAKSQGGPWSTDFVEMARKTVIKRLLKRHDLSPEFNAAKVADDAHERGAPADFSELASVIDVKPAEPRTKAAPESVEEREERHLNELDKMADDLMKQREAKPEPEPDTAEEAPPEDGSDAEWGDGEEEKAPLGQDPDPAQPDRRQRRTCVDIIKQNITRLGQEKAKGIRDRVLADNGLGGGPVNLYDVDLDVLRMLTRALESAEA